MRHGIGHRKSRKKNNSGIRKICICSIYLLISLHLNWIENLWRKIKYEWRRAEDYLSTQQLKKAIFNIIKQYDKEYFMSLSTENFFK